MHDDSLAGGSLDGGSLTRKIEKGTIEKEPNTPLEQLQEPL
jgi:hypothetical protein